MISFYLFRSNVLTAYPLYSREINAMILFMEEIYPKNHQEFLKWFRREEDCWDYLYKLRWPNGFACPICNHDKGWRKRRNLTECTSCHHETSITSGTIFQGTRKPLTLWFNVIWQLVSQKTGSSAQNLKDAMDFGSYQTTWSWLHKLRRAMVRPGRDRLKGEVEVDETFIGGKRSGRRGRGAYGKTLVVVATECLGKRCGRVRFRCIPAASEQYLLPFISDFIEPGSKIITDGWEGYHNLDKSVYPHEIKTIKGSGKQAHDLLPHVHLVDSLVKKWINGTHQGNIDPYHLPSYLDEFAFRFNRRLSTHRGKLFFRLIQQALITSPKPYKEIVKSKPTDGSNSLAQLVKDLNVNDKKVWALKKIRTVDPIVARSVRELSKLEPLKYIKITGDGVVASNIIEGTRNKKPIAKPFHPTAIGIHLIYDFQFKTLEFYEMNSASKGWGEKMVKAALRTLPQDWQPSLVMDCSDGFWDKMKSKYNHLDWLKI